MPVSASLNLISLVAEPGVLHYTKLFLNFLTLAVAGIFLCVRAGVTQVGSMKLALFFKQGLDSTSFSSNQPWWFLVTGPGTWKAVE